MRNNYYKWIIRGLWGLGLTLLVMSCQYPIEAPTSATGNSISILYPADGAQLPNNQTQRVQSRGQVVSGASAVVLSVNDAQYRQDTFLHIVHSGEIYQPWTPHQPGVYTLQVVLLLEDGSSVVSEPIDVIVGETSAATDTPFAKMSETPTVTMDVTPTITQTVTPDQPMATVNQNSYCRSGPYSAYPELDTFGTGQTLAITGINQERTWVQVHSPIANRKCWIWMNLVDVSGNIEQVQTVYVPPPATATFTPTKRPTKVPTFTPTKVGPTKP